MSAETTQPFLLPSEGVEGWPEQLMAAECVCVAGRREVNRAAPFPPTPT